MAKFKISKITTETNKKGEEFKVIKYNHYKKGVSESKIKKALKKTISSIPAGFEYTITTLNSVGWRASGKGWRSLNDDIRVYDPNDLYGVELDDPLEFYSAVILLREVKPEAGGTSNKNDCLFNCLKKKLDLTWTYPGSLKKFLGIGRCEPVHYNKIEKLEKKLTTSIRIYGDKIYNSGSKYSRVIELDLIDGHYTNRKNNSPMKKEIKDIFIKKEESELLLYTAFKDYVLTYDGDDFENIETSKFYKMQNNKYNNKYFYINGQCLVKDSIEEAQEKLETLYKDNTKWITEIKERKDKNDFSVNPLLFSTMNQAVIYYAYYWGLDKFETETLTELEAKFIDDAFTGGLIYADKGIHKKVKCYDVNSMYPNFFSNSGLLIPLKRGTFTKETEIKDIVPFGIYKCKIIGDIDAKLFRINPTNTYTHYDINSARRLGYEVKLIQNNQVNVLLYGGSDRTPAKSIFKKYIEFFYAIKKDLKGNRLAKSFLNLLWGVMCQKKTITRKITDTEDSNLLLNTTVYGDECYAVCYQDQTLFKSPMSRLGPFLTSYARKYMSELMTPYTNDILRCHTDGFILQGKHKIETSKDIGKLKLEYKADKIEIIHVNKIKKF